MAAARYDDMVHDYRLVPEDFVKHLMSTLAIVSVVVLVAALLFGVPEKKPLTIKDYATANPITFEQVAVNNLNGQGRIANYGPPYNHGTGNVESGLQKLSGIWHPINAAQDFILKPLAMAESLDPAIKPALTRYEHASHATQLMWADNYTKALTKARYVNGTVVVPPGNYGPVQTLMNATLKLGQSGLMSGALIRNPNVVTRFNNQNYLLFLQGTPLHQAAAPLQMKGTQWGIIHPAVPGYPGPWWMTIPTWIYQWPFVANSPANDAIALSIGMLVWLLLALIPWIPGLNKLPRYLGVYKLIWAGYYRAHRYEGALPKQGVGSR
ncbi:Cytochrome B6 [Candidatus Hydrogenisulfobacillus filiaventi]|uniref:Cytochrome B6 n=1 Tax=Candidatus Hydrogenisulfobacillus filiaventi TaxID=2707344 RepID=A0A6F8ZK65_9FIRM|nr:cytochrome B6 [Bacillota bacterium]CAB1130073.1 Cytochrome B6 [Candidatus Hydrogenisulfobacillus filiaventi]